MNNYSDGLDFLIKNRVCIADEYELTNVNNELCSAFKKLVAAAEEKNMGYYRKSTEFQAEIDELASVLKKQISNLERMRVTPYQLYLIYREILSICIACPYLLPREMVYNVFRRGMQENLY